MQLIPAIDLRQGRVVRLVQGDDARRTTYDRDPLDLLAEFAGAGVERVHIVDLDAAFGEAPQRPLIARLTASTDLQVELGGGLRNEEALRWALGIGCDRLVLGSVVAREFDTFRRWVELFPGRLVPALEVMGEEIKVAGWTESAELRLDELCRRLRGFDCPAALVTDVARDGTLAGPNLELARKVARDSGIPALLSGGVHSLADLEKAAAAAGELSGVILGKALYDGRIALADALAILPGATRRTASGAEKGLSSQEESP